MNIETHLKLGLDPIAYDVMTSENVIPAAKRLKTVMKCFNADCEIEAAKQVGAKYVLTSEHSFYNQTNKHYLTLKVHDVETNRFIATQQFVYEKESDAININPHQIVKSLNDQVPSRVDITPKKMTFPKIPAPPLPKAEDVGNVLLASAIAGPVIYLFVDNFSNIAGKY
tara:strand:+ start:140 stop:646 length:507 start_codon:yes stop_codon:yes gene_type:complete